ncbi:hypothetical protein F511_18867 [Dorcoceras hygrometricum]|uniref:Uncharacterized protein n=1 Tax=Dorcoceras hygrometricum TaxID=472368 RepID=A0A2Z7AUE8_9LAMI|nr:hypothetical protein F511_18867 [Dorcoceras hygrometricum]
MARVKRLRYEEPAVARAQWMIRRRFDLREYDHRTPHTIRNSSVRTAANSRQSSAAVSPNPLAKVLRKLRRVQKLLLSDFSLKSCEQLCEV